MVNFDPKTRRCRLFWAPFWSLNAQKRFFFFFIRSEQSSFVGSKIDHKYGRGGGGVWAGGARAWFSMQLHSTQKWEFLWIETVSLFHRKRCQIKRLRSVRLRIFVFECDLRLNWTRYPPSGAGIFPNVIFWNLILKIYGKQQLNGNYAVKTRP